MPPSTLGEMRGETAKAREVQDVEVESDRVILCPQFCLSLQWMKQYRGHTLKRILGDIHIDALAYADDVLLLAENGEGLQTKLDIICKNSF